MQLLPVDIDASADRVDAGSAAGSALPADAPMILLVDDEREVLQALAVALRADGFRVATAANGADAIDKAETLRPEMVVTDLLMPVVDGIGLAKALRANPATAAARIVMCSGVSEASVRPLFSGYDAFLRKPYGLDDLRQTLASLL